MNTSKLRQARRELAVEEEEESGEGDIELADKEEEEFGEGDIGLVEELLTKFT